MKELTERICKVCGKKYLHHLPHTTIDFCSDRCKRISELGLIGEHKIICKECGKEYIFNSKQDNWYKNNVAKNGRGTILSYVFCSYECGIKDRERHIIETDIMHHGILHTKLESNKQKIRETNIIKHGNPNYNNAKQRIQTNIKKYGEKLESIQEKRKQSCLEKYGSEHYTQSDHYNKRINLYNVKQFRTKRQNGTLESSKISDKIYKLLQEKFKYVIKEYKSEKYPWKCDFYIPELDLYIEYQGYRCHGSEPFNENNQKHIRLIEKWKQKAKELNFAGKKKLQYLKFIKTWTQEDVEKRNKAKENNLNYLEFFNEKQFMNWYNQQEDI